MSLNKPAEAADRRRRSSILAALVVVGAALFVVVGRHPVGLVPATSAPLAASPIDTPHGNHHRVLGQFGGDHRRRTPGKSTSTPPKASGEADGALAAGVSVFDDRIPALANLDPGLLAALRLAARGAARDGVEIFVNSGWRSPEYQERLLREAVSKYGSEAEAARWVATPATSPHVSGDAVDIGPSDATVWLSEHGADYGLCQTYGNEPWHYELRPEAMNDDCPAMHPDPTHDPRMRR